MRQFMMAVMALTAFAATVATAHAEKQTARSSQTITADTVYCINSGPQLGQLRGRCYDNLSDCVRVLGWYYGVYSCWPRAAAPRRDTCSSFGFCAGRAASR
jgi:hypothetical protein